MKLIITSGYNNKKTCYFIVIFALIYFDIIQRLPHLPIRMKEHSRRGLAVAGMVSRPTDSLILPGGVVSQAFL